VTGGEAEHGIRKLSPKVVDTDHRMFRVVCDCGVYIGRTHLSHGASGRDLGTLANLMARQLHIPMTTFRDLVGCTIGRAEYLAARGHQHTAGSTS
jgi:hypothetical protein